MYSPTMEVDGCQRQLVLNAFAQPLVVLQQLGLVVLLEGSVEEDACLEGTTGSLCWKWSTADRILMRV